MRNSQVGRKRNRTMEPIPTLSITKWVWKVLYLIVTMSFVEGFTMVPSHFGTIKVPPITHTVQPLAASASVTATRASNLKSRQRRLSSDEQQELFRHVMESRRIRSLEQEAPDTTMELSRAAGYGSEVRELEEAMVKGDEARERLITTNMGLVHYCVHDILKSRAKLRYITIDDLVQEGAIGLARAVDKYNPLFYDRSHAPPPKFSTYAVYWIRAAILRCITERDDVMRVPEHVSAAVRKITQAEQSLGWRSLGEEEDDDSLAEHVMQDDSTSVVWSKADRKTQQDILAETTGLSDQMLHNAMMVRNRRRKHGTSVLSYESWMQQGQHFETDLQQRSSSTDPLPGISTEHIQQTLSRFLRPKEMEALSWRYGLKESNPLAKKDYLARAEAEVFGVDSIASAAVTAKGKWGEAMSFTEVGRQMQVSAEYGRRLCHQALDKLRRAVADGMLEPALLV